MFATRPILLPLVAALAGCALLAPAASAHGIEISLGKKSKHSHVGITFSTGPSYCPPPRTWVAGHYETRCEQVWVPGVEQRVWVAPVYEWRHDSCGRAYQVQVRPGYWKTICSPGHSETREYRVWVEGCWR